MYVNQNKLIAIIVLVITSIGYAEPDVADHQTTQSVIIVGLSKNKVIIMDQRAKHKILNVGEITGDLELVSSSSAAAIFKDLRGKLITIGISDQISAAYNYNQEEFNNETISLNKNNQYETTIILEGKEFKGIIDTGANFVTINRNIANQLNFDYKKEENKINVNTADNKTNGYKITISSIKLGDIQLNNIDAVVMDNDQPENVLIGMTFLKNLDLKYSGDKLKLKKHQASQDNSSIKNKTTQPTTK